MTAQSSPLELVPMDPPAAEPAPAGKSALAIADDPPLTIDIPPLERTAPKPPQPGAEAKVDRFAREASRQFADGHLDQPLWDRAFAQAKGDQREATDIYLRARATALRLLDREQRHAEHQRKMQPAAVPAEVPADETEDEFGPTESALLSRQRLEQRKKLARYRMAGIAVGALLAVGLVAWGVLSLLKSDDPVPAAPVVKPAVPAVPKAAPVAAKAAGKDAANAPAPVTADFRKKIQELNDAGNWNLLVLYSVEWTRREPANADAWDQLRDAYAKMRQYDDALGAAGKAVELAPANAQFRRSLGQAYVDVDDPVGAVNAFEEAVARDPADVDSLRQIGTMLTMQGKPVEAKAAFERALVLSPGDPTATCLRNGFAQMPPPSRDARATLKLIKAIDAKCHGLGGPEVIPVK